MSSTAAPLQSKTASQLAAVAVGVLPVYSISIVLQLLGGRTISVQGFIFYLAVIAPLAIVIALLLLRFLCGENLRDLNLRPGKLSSDLLAVLVLCLVILVANAISTYTLSGLFPESASNTSVRALFVELTHNPNLLVLFVGPLLLLGAASEELIRVFLLSRLWKVFPSLAAKSFAVFASASFFGLAHLYQGQVHVVWGAIYGLIMGFYYLRFGRVAPLVLAHYMTNAIQVGVVAVLAR